MTDLPPTPGSRPEPTSSDADGEPPVLPGLARNALAQLAARVGGGLVQAAALILVARAFGPEQYGVFALVFTLAVLVVVFAEWGLTLAGTRVVAYGRADAPTVLATVIGLRLALAVGAMGVLVLLALASTPDRTVLFGSLVAGLSFFPQAWLGAAHIRAQLDLRLDRIAAALFAGNLATFAWIAGGLALGAGVVTLAAGLVVSGVTAAAVAIRLTPAGLPLLPRLHRELWRDLLRESTPIAATLVLVTVYFYIDVVLLARLSTTEQLGLYNAAYRFVQFGIFVPGILVWSVYAVAAQLAKRDRQRFGVLVSELLSLALLLVPLPIVLLAVAAEDVMVLFFGDEFAPAGSALVPLAAALGVMIVTGTVAPLLLALGRERANLAISAAAVVLNVALNLVLIPRLEADGAALTTLATELLVFALAFPLLFRAAPIRIDGRYALKVVTAAAAAAAAVAFVPAPVLARLAVAFALYVVLLVTTKAVGRRQLELTRTARSSAVAP